MWGIRPTLENTGLKRAMEQIRKERAVRTWRFFSKFFPGRGWDKRGIYWLPSHRLTRLAFRQKCFEYVFRKRYSISFYIPLFLSFFSSSFFFFYSRKEFILHLSFILCSYSYMYYPIPVIQFKFYAPFNF